LDGILHVLGWFGRHVELSIKAPKCCEIEKKNARKKGETMKRNNQDKEKL